MITISMMFSLWLGLGVAAIGPEMTYQGELADGAQVANGQYDFQFFLYDAEIGGVELAPSFVVDDAVVTDGIFTVQLDFGFAFDAGDAAWIELGVREGSSSDPYTLLSPRQPLTAAPYAQVASAVTAGAIDSLDLADDSVQADDIAANSVGLSEIIQNQVQRRINGVCGAQEFAIGVDANGSLNCESSLDAGYWLGAPNGISYPSRVGIGTNTPEFGLHVNGEFFVNSSVGRMNFGSPGDGNRWRFSTQGSGSNLQMQSKPSGSNTFTRRVYFHQNGNVAMGDNSNPDQQLVVGDNLGSGWTETGITAGNATGGVVEVGNADYQLSMTSSSSFGRGRIISTSPTGFGRGEIEMRTNGLSVGENPGPPGSHMLKVEHGSFGMLLSRAGTDNTWELLASSAAAGNLNLYTSGSGFVGRFDGTTGAYTTTSDRKYKSEIRQLGSVLDKVLALRPSRYQYKKDSAQLERIGFIAQEVQPLFPELVTQVDEDRATGLTVDYAGFGVLAVRALQEQQEKIDQLELLVAQLAKRVEQLESSR